MDERRGRACAGLRGCGSRMPGGLRAWRAGSGFRRWRVTPVRTAQMISSSHRDTVRARLTSSGMSSLQAHQSQKAKSRSRTLRSHGTEPATRARRFSAWRSFSLPIQAAAISCPAGSACRVPVTLTRRHRRCGPPPAPAAPAPRTGQRSRRATGRRAAHTPRSAHRCATGAGRGGAHRCPGAPPAPDLLQHRVRCADERLMRDRPRHSRVPGRLGRRDPRSTTSAAACSRSLPPVELAVLLRRSGRLR